MTAETKREMKKMLEEIRSGKYAEGWIAENASGRQWFEGKRREERAHQIEKVGAELRALMPFLKPVTHPRGGSDRRRRAEEWLRSRPSDPAAVTHGSRGGSPPLLEISQALSGTLQPALGAAPGARRCSPSITAPCAAW